jgi:hypothetical protein
MNPDLEALIKAYLAVHESTGRQRARCLAAFEAMLDDALRDRPGISRELFLEAVRRRSHAFVKAQSRPPALPPQA